MDVSGLVSARTGEGIDKLFKELADYVDQSKE